MRRVPLGQYMGQTRGRMRSRAAQRRRLLDAMSTIAARREPAHRREAYHCGQQEPARLADGGEQDDEPTEVAIGLVEHGRQPALGHRADGGQDRERGRQGRMRTQRQEERNRDGGPGQGADEALRDGKQPEGPIRTRREGAPIGDGRKTSDGTCAHGPIDTLSGSARTLAGPVPANIGAGRPSRATDMNRLRHRDRMVTWVIGPGPRVSAVRHASCHEPCSS